MFLTYADNGADIERMICLRMTYRTEATQMRIAVTYQNGVVFQHFGHTEQFKLYSGYFCRWAGCLVSTLPDFTRS